MDFYEGRVVVVTGASAGLGVEFARQLAPSAECLVLVARRGERLEALACELESQYPSLRVRVYAADISIEENRLAFAQWLQSERIAVDMLVNNAGLGDHGDFAGSEWQRVRSMLDVNMVALTHLTFLLLPALAASERGAVLNVSSVASFFPLPGLAVYAATKAYVTSFTEALDMELRPQGIRVAALCPGPIPTEFYTVAKRSQGRGCGSTLRRSPHYETMPAFVVSSQKAVRVGLRALARGRVRVVPGALLAVCVGAALLVPFILTRQILRLAAPKL